EPGHLRREVRATVRAPLATRSARLSASGTPSAGATERLDKQELVALTACDARRTVALARSLVRPSYCDTVDVGNNLRAGRKFNYIPVVVERQQRRCVAIAGHGGF